MELDPFLLFNSALRSNQTKEKYQRRLDIFFDFIALPKCSLNERCRIFIENSKKNPTTYPINCVFKFIMYQKERLQNKEIVVSTIYNYLKPIKLLCEMNDIHVKWKKITIGLPKERKYADDRAPTIEEIQKLIEYPDRRIKAIILTMSSSGIRVGAWDDLKWKHIKPIEQGGNIVAAAAKIIVYAGSDEQYNSFISAEAYQALNEWMDFRKKSGEKVTDESWLMRNLWDVTTPTGGPRGLISIPKKLKFSGVKSLIERALRAQGIRTKLEEGKKRYPFPADHGFRKFFKTRCEIAGMKSINIENLMNHSIGVSNSYYRPQEKELLDDYLKAVEHLTIKENNNNTGIEKGVVEERIKAIEEKHAKEINDLRENMESKFEQIFLKIDSEKVLERNNVIH
jgi:site-specific recombinase XerC